MSLAQDALRRGKSPFIE